MDQFALPTLAGQFDVAHFILVGIIVILIAIVSRTVVNEVVLEQLRRIAPSLRDVLLTSPHGLPVGPRSANVSS
jgi:hypothetical protein